MLTEQLKPIIYWVGLGASLIVYAHANFSTKEAVRKLEDQVEKQATKEDVREIKASVDKIYIYLLEGKGK